MPKSGLSSLLNSLATIGERICIGSASNALSVSTHFVSTGATLHFATAVRSSTFSNTPSSRSYFSSFSRACFTACQGSSFPVMCECILLASLCHHRIVFRFQVLLTNSNRSTRFSTDGSFILIFFASSPTFGSPISIFLTNFPVFGSHISVFFIFQFPENPSQSS